MRKVYWRPREVSRAALVFIAGLSALSFAAVEILQQQNRQPYHREKLAAAHLAEQAFQVIKQGSSSASASAWTASPTPPARASSASS
jgi:hypothetical protein